jgi:hypothetical protein
MASTLPGARFWSLKGCVASIAETLFGAKATQYLDTPHGIDCPTALMKSAGPPMTLDTAQVGVIGWCRPRVQTLKVIPPKIRPEQTREPPSSHYEPPRFVRGRRRR